MSPCTPYPGEAKAVPTYPAEVKAARTFSELFAAYCRVWPKPLLSEEDKARWQTNAEYAEYLWYLAEKAAGPRNDDWERHAYAALLSTVKGFRPDFRRKFHDLFVFNFKQKLRQAAARVAQSQELRRGHELAAGSPRARVAPVTPDQAYRTWGLRLIGLGCLRLDTRTRTYFTMRCLNGAADDEVAASLGLRPNTVNNKLSKKRVNSAVRRAVGEVLSDLPLEHLRLLVSHLRGEGVPPDLIRALIGRDPPPADRAVPVLSEDALLAELGWPRAEGLLPPTAEWDEKRSHQRGKK